MSCLPSRKRQHPPDNVAGEGSNVKVVVRIRPQNVKETEGNFRVVVQAVDENILVFDPKENVMDFGRKRGRRDIRKRQNRDLKFAFDRVFGPEARNSDIYNETTDSVLAGVLNGYNCSVFAYGATGAGKTHTMLGTKEQPGVIYHTMVDLYSRMDSIKDDTTCDVAVSYLEVYNETIRDLLMPGPQLPVREDPGKGVIIPGLSLHKPKSADELLYMLQLGNQHRTQHPTDANAESSRSHAVFQVFVRQKDRTANISTEVRVAKMCLVDLAGSERATVTKNKGSRFREGANINRSLLALGNVINALAENKNKGFVPYRDSKLTRLLKDSLGGNCQTVMIAAVSPSAMSFEDTYNTLRYANRAKNIKATLKKNVLNVDFHMAKYGQIVTELRKEISELKNKLNHYEEGGNMPVAVPTAVVPDMSSFIGYQNELEKFFTSHLTLRSDQLQQEIALKNLQWKLYRKNRCVTRVKAISDIEAQTRLETVIKGMNQKSSCMTVSSEMTRGKLAENLNCFHDIDSRMKQCGSSDVMPQIFDLCAENHRNKLELQDTKQYLSFTKQVIRCQERELHHNERLIVQLLKLIKSQHYILKGHNFMTCDLEKEFKDIVKKVGGQELTWEDQVADGDSAKSCSLSEMLDLPTVNLKLSAADVKQMNTHGKPVSGDSCNNKRSVWPASQTTDKPLPYTQVDECSPPKAKRIMLTHPLVQQQQQPVRHEPTGRHRPRNNWSRSTNQRSQAVNSGRSRSYSESNMLKNKTVNSTANFNKNTNPPDNRALRVLQQNCNERDISPDSEVQTNSRFTKVMDTITKAKKFSLLHTHNVNTKPGLAHLGENTDTLDGTFTIEEAPNAPVSLPCVNTDTVSEVCSHFPNSDTYVINSSDMCTKCDSQRQTKTSPITDNEKDLGVSMLNMTYETEKQKSDSNANDSNTSTLVNQSASSQSSLASVSTLVENLSQNLSNTEDNNSIIENPDLSAHLERLKNDNNTENSQMLNVSDDPSETKVNNEISVKLPSIGGTVIKTSQGNKPVNAQTVTKTRGSLEGKNENGNSSKVNGDVLGKPTKAARCIVFGEKNGKDSSGSMTVTKTPDRKPLQQVCNSNTPQTDRSSLGSLPSSTDSDLSFDKSLNKDRLMSGRTKLFEKENLSNFGLPLLSEGSLIIKDKNKAKKNQSSATPGYMQSTKAYNHRIKHKSINSDADKVDHAPGRVKTSIPNQRPLMSSMRSKSLSNLSSRSGWQF